MEELQEAHQQIQEQEATISQLEADREKAEKRADQMKAEMEKTQTNSANLEKQLSERLVQLERANAEIKRMEKETKQMSKEKGELVKENRQIAAKLMNKTAQERMGDERERGMIEDLNAEKAKNMTAAARIRELEQVLFIPRIGKCAYFSKLKVCKMPGGTLPLKYPMVFICPMH
jgi:septal ring factor EnvC (AmiA/AmiB activator)